MKRQIRLVFLIFLACQEIAFASASGVGNTGQVVNQPDGSVKPADYLIPQLKSSDFHPEVIHELERAFELLVQMGSEPITGNDSIKVDGLDSYSTSLFYHKKVVAKAVDYFLVDTLPISECYPINDTVTPVTGGVDDIACTHKYETWIKKDLFNAMTPRDQAMVILHERLHTLMDDNGEHPFIAGITTAITSLLDLQDAQNAGQIPTLDHFNPFPAPNTFDVFEGVKELPANIVRLGLRDDKKDNTDYLDEILNDWSITSAGGLVHNSATIDAKSYVGVGSIVGANSTIVQSTLLGSQCLGAQCQITRSQLMGAHFTAHGTIPFVVNVSDANLAQSSFDNDLSDPAGQGHHLVISAGDQITNTHFMGIQNARIGSNAVIRDSSISLDTPSQTVASILQIGQGDTLQGVNAHFGLLPIKQTKTSVTFADGIKLTSGPAVGCGGLQSSTLLNNLVVQSLSDLGPCSK